MAERETDQEQRDRKDKETSDYRRARQERLGHVPAKKKGRAKKEESAEEE